MFGIECEFDQGVLGLARELHMAGLVRDNAIHSYHCSCSGCDHSANNRYPLHIQSDSSCNGEVISKPFKTVEEIVPVLNLLQSYTVKVDAHPGMNSGTHVHVTSPVSSRSEDALQAFMQNEQWLIRNIATGRFPCQRSNNTSLEDLHEDHDECLEDPNYLYGCHYDQDRHSNLNICTNYGTWEFRLWNSTRSAWRWEMYIRTSLLFVEWPQIILQSGVIEAAKSQDPRLSELITRQLAYVDNKRGTFDPFILDDPNNEESESPF